MNYPKPIILYHDDHDINYDKIEIDVIITRPQYQFYVDAGLSRKTIIGLITSSIIEYVDDDSLISPITAQRYAEQWVKYYEEILGA